MKNDEQKNSLEDLKKGYKKIQAPKWLLRDTLQKAEQQKNKQLSPWVVAIYASLAVLILLFLIPQQPQLHKPIIKQPSLVGLHASKVKPESFHMPSISVLQRIPTIPRTPKIPRQPRFTS